jgi:hypothetical protein
MPRFRSRSAADVLCDVPLSQEMIRWLCSEVTRPCHFFVGPRLHLQWEHQPSEECVWEIFQGRLLDPAHTRERHTFESWNINQVSEEARSGEPLLSLKLDHDPRQIHVVRGIDSYVHEGYDSGGGVFLTRERRKWIRELVGTVELSLFRDLEELRDELICLLFNAVVGTSRLPLAPAETPLPAFSFGQLFYCFRNDEPTRTTPVSSRSELERVIRTEALTAREQVKWFETYLHTVAPDEWEEAAVLFAYPWPFSDRQGDLTALIRGLFNEVSLSPYTDLAANLMVLLRQLERFDYFSASAIVDVLGWLLRQNGRHLTAYDLVTFHHRGANYPDALLLDEVLKEYFSYIDRFPDLFVDRLRRRGLRQAWLHRRAYEGHPVPDEPTSPGEQRRVMPPSHPRVSEEQIEQPAKRKRRLFANDPLTKYLTPNVEKVLRQSLVDFEHPDELRELGMALYLDRPFNFGKPPAEPDGTLLLSAEAFSRNLALQRLHRLPHCFEGVADSIPANCEERLQKLPVNGLPLPCIGSPGRPGIISLTDARLASPDFVFRRTTTSTVRNFLSLYDVAPLAERFDIPYLTDANQVLFTRAANGEDVIVYDGEMRPRLQIRVPAQFGYQRRAGHEFPTAGLWVVAVWQGEQRLDLQDAPIILKVR